MLLAVEGGGFFSSSASGYSKGLMLLLLGQSKDERQMRVAPWSHYQLVEQEGSVNHQLATRKAGASRGCVPFGCFRGAHAEADGHSPSKVSLANQSGQDSSLSVSDVGEACSTSNRVEVSGKKLNIKSSLKKPPSICLTSADEIDHAHDSVEEGQNNIASCTEMRNVHWTDTCGGELTEIREYEPSEDDEPDDDFALDGTPRCDCVIQ